MQNPNYPSTKTHREKSSGVDNKTAIGRALKYLTHYRRQAALPYIFLLIATLSSLAVPRLVRGVIDAVTSGVMANSLLAKLPAIPQAFIAQALPQILSFLKLPADYTFTQLTDYLTTQAAGAPRALLYWGIAIVLFAILRGVFSFLQAYWAERNSQSMAFDMRNDLYAKIQRLSFSYHDRNQTGQLMIRATDDVEKVRMFIGQGLLQLVGAFTLLSGTLIIIFLTNVKLALVTLWILPVALVLFMVFGRISQPMFTKVQQKMSRLNTILQENLAGIKVVKAFTREASEQAKFDRSVDDLMAQQIQVARLFSFMFPVVFMIANLGQATTLYAGGQQIIRGTLTLGEWQEFSLYLMYLFFPIAMFGMIITQFGQAAASARRIFEILDAKIEVTDKPQAITLPSVQGHVRFENVSFRYFGSSENTNGSEPVLKDVNFDASPGQTIALLGATGSGKTSIINLLPRFYDPTSGRIAIDGHDIRDVTLELVALADRHRTAGNNPVCRDDPG